MTEMRYSCCNSEIVLIISGECMRGDRSWCGGHDGSETTLCSGSGIKAGYEIIESHQLICFYSRRSSDIV